MQPGAPVGALPTLPLQRLRLLRRLGPAFTARSCAAAGFAAVSPTTGGVHASLGRRHRLRDVLPVVWQQSRGQLPAVQVQGMRCLQSSASAAVAAVASDGAIAIAAALGAAGSSQRSAITATVAARGVRARGHRLRGYRLRGLLPVVRKQC